MNELNEKIYDSCSFVSGPVYQKQFITSKTELTSREYGDIPNIFVKRFKISEKEWRRVQKIYVLRACIMSPYLANYTTLEEYWNRFIQIMKDVITK